MARGVKCLERLVLGIDEAGRGPLLGPMVVAGVVLEEEKTVLLEEIGVKDSKLLDRGKREELYTVIEEAATHIIVVSIEPWVIDSVNLNTLEYDVVGFIVRRAVQLWGAALRGVFVDAVGPVHKLRSFLAKVLQALEARPEIVVERKADRHYLPVAAASIVAKVVRDRAISLLEEEYGPLGSGYPHDPRTRKWVREAYQRYNVPPPIVRLTWSSLKELAPRWYRPKEEKKLAQSKTLLDYLRERSSGKGSGD